MKDEFDEYLEAAMRDPVFAQAFRRAGLRRVDLARERRVAGIVRRINRRREKRVASHLGEREATVCVPCPPI